MHERGRLPYAEAYAGFRLDEVEARLHGSRSAGLNACVECCDRHVGAGGIALEWENAAGERESYTFAALQGLSARFAGMLTAEGIGPGDVVAGLLPRIPDLVVTILGTWRAGAVYQPLFTAFGPSAIEHRLQTSGARLVVTDAANRGKLDGLTAAPRIAVARGGARPGDLDLTAELARHTTAEGRRWHGAVRPLGEAFADRFMRYLPKADYPVRAGVHSNTAFALILALDYARTCGDQALWDLVFETATGWYGEDEACQAWEPDGDAFLSPALTEAALMADLIVAEDFAEWFDGFLPDAEEERPATLFEPVRVSDRTDGKIAHLDGLNLSRAWAFGKIAAVLTEEHSAWEPLMDARARHLAAALDHVAGDYMGEHWLASFALLALSETP